MSGTFEASCAAKGELLFFLLPVLLLLMLL